MTLVASAMAGGDCSRSTGVTSGRSKYRMGVEKDGSLHIRPVATAPRISDIARRVERVE